MENVITIITPLFNAEKYIKRCIESILNQTYVNIEFIIVNDGSTDRTLEICESYACYDNRIKLLNQKNQGVSVARNIALEQSHGEYIIFVDSDDWVEETFCEKMYNKAIREKADVVICEYNNYYEKTNENCFIKLKKYNNRTFNELISDDSTLYGGFIWNKMIRKKIIKKKFNEKIHYYENLLFLLENCKNVKYSLLNENLYNYCINENSAVHTKKFNIKKNTALEALLNVIDNIEVRKNKDEYKMCFFNTYYKCLLGMKKEDIKSDKFVDKYFKYVEKYKSELLLSNDITFVNKLRILFLRYFTNIYFLIVSLKELK